MGRRNEYAELQRQVADLKVAVRQAHERVDNLGELVTKLISDLRSDIFKGLQDVGNDLTRNTEAVHQARAAGSVEEAGVQRILAEIQGIRADAAQARAAALEEDRRRYEEERQRQEEQKAVEAELAVEQVAPASDESSEQDGEHEKLLDLAADVARAELSCHRDTWAFLVERSIGGIEHFRLPGDIDEDDGMVTVDISGRTLIAVIEALWETQSTAEGNGTRALAGRAYRRIGEAVQSLEPASDRRQAVPRIVIDARPPQPAADAGPGGDSAAG